MSKSIGIIGGMGPLATADIFRKIVLLTKAGGDNGHIRVFMDNNPAIPDRTAAILGKGPDPVPEIAKAIKSLEACGADCLVMPCNTAHYFLPRLKKMTDIPFISMLEATAEACAAAFPGKTAALLGTRGTIESGIYEKPLGHKGVCFVLPDEDTKDILMDSIYAVKAGHDIEPLRDGFLAAMHSLKAQGAGYFILGCTELPLVFDALGIAEPYIDPTAELAKAAIRFCDYEVKG